jgi:cobalt-zinc-cadmium efflux system membrane fusion protein
MRAGRWISIILLLVAGFSCKQGPEQQESIDGVPVKESGVVLSADVVEKAGITFGVIDYKMLSHDISARGQILLLPDKQANVSVMMGGTIQSIRVTYGQKVRKGEVLAYYTHPEIIELQQHYLNAKYMMVVMEKEYERQESLWKEKVKSEKEYQYARLEYQKAKADFQATRSKISMMNVDVNALDEGQIQQAIPIVSPINGQVEEINVSLGQFVDMHNPLFLVIDKSAPVLQLKVFEKDIHLIEKGQRVTFASSTSAVEDLEAEIFNVGSIVDQEARIIYVMARISGQVPGLIPGMFVASTVHTREQDLKALPETAVVIENENTRFGFYTTDPEGSTELRFKPFLLNTGFMEDGYVEVYPVEELPENARIVLTGVYYLKSEMMKALGD